MDLMDAYNATSARDPRERRRLLTELLGAIGELRPRLPPRRTDAALRSPLHGRSP
ncbi:maltose acetyltransferase domain-containing protein [Nonomuraea sp. NPDC003201]